HFAEVPKLNALLEMRAGPEVRVRTHGHIVFQRCAFEHRCLDPTALTYLRVAHDRVRADARAGSDTGAPLEDAAALDDGIRRDLDVGIDHRRRGIVERDAGRHVAFGDPPAHPGLRGRE